MWVIIFREFCKRKSKACRSSQPRPLGGPISKASGKDAGLLAEPVDEDQLEAPLLKKRWAVRARGEHLVPPARWVSVFLESPAGTADVSVAVLVRRAGGRSCGVGSGWSRVPRSGPAATSERRRNRGGRAACALASRPAGCLIAGCCCVSGFKGRPRKASRARAKPTGTNVEFCWFGLCLKA